MKKGLISLLIFLTACVPTVDLGDVASRAANKAVETAVSSAVTAVVQGIVGGILDRVVDLIVTAALSGIFPADGELEFTSDFVLDIYTGSYDLTIEGVSEAGNYSFAGGQPVNDQDEFSYAVGLRGQSDEGERFSALNLLRVNDTDEVGFSFVIVEDEAMPGQFQAGLQFLDDESEEAIYVGMVDVVLTQSTATRYAGSFNAANLVRQDTGESLSINGMFDVPINPAGSLIIRAGQE